MSAFGHRIWLLAVVLTPWAMSDSEAASDGLASHRAIYGMSLKSADQSSDIAELTGQMLIEVTASAGTQICRVGSFNAAFPLRQRHVSRRWL